MRVRTIIILSLVTMACSTFTGQTFSGAAREVAEADRSWAQAFHAHDLDRAVRTMTEDALVFAPNAPAASGRAQIHDMYGRFLAMRGLDFTWQPLHVDVASAGDLAVSDGVYTMTHPGPDGTSIKETGKYLTVWRRQQNGQWLATREIFNADPARP